MDSNLSPWVPGRDSNLNAGDLITLRINTVSRGDCYGASLPDFLLP